MVMNAAHDLDRVGNDAIVVKGRHWIISSKISVGKIESIVQALAKQQQNRGRYVASVDQTPDA